MISGWRWEPSRGWLREQRSLVCRFAACADAENLRFSLGMTESWVQDTIGAPGYRPTAEAPTLSRESNMPAIHELIYASSETRPTTPADLAGILAIAREKNAARG